MANGFSAEQFIDAPPDKVWSVATNPLRMHEWMPGVMSVAEADVSDMQKGKRFTVVLDSSDGGSEREMTLSEWNPPHYFALASKEGRISAVYAYEVAPDGDGTRIRLNATCSAGNILMKILHPLIVHMMAKHDRPQVDLLKALVEA